MKQLVGALVVALVSVSAGSASAAPITVGGVMWDPDSPFDFSATDSMVEQTVGIVGQELIGYARINNINQTSQATFCPGCELTYVFDQYLVSDVTGNDVAFTGGRIRLFVDAAQNFDPAACGLGCAADGNLWMTLGGVDSTNASTGQVGTLFAQINSGVLGTGTEGGTGLGLLEVLGGVAAPYFDTNSIVIPNPAGTADFTFTSSFQPIPNGGTTADGFPLFGSNDIAGVSQNIPEPTILSMFGLGLLGVGFAARRRRNRAD